MTDQHRPDFSAREGFPINTMPTLDSLANGGVQFRHAYTSSPVCSPVRCSFLTGRFPSAHGFKANYCDKPRYEKDLVDVLNTAGYTTALIGKDHTYRQCFFKGQSPAPLTRYHYWMNDEILEKTVHPDPVLRSMQEDFERWMKDLAHWISEEPTPFPAKLQQPVRVIDYAMEWIKNFRQEPFYLFLGIDPPHNPYQVPEPYFSLFDEDKIPPPVVNKSFLKNKNFQWQFLRRLIEYYYPNPDKLLKRYRANYCGMLRLIDDQISRLLEFLRESGLRENTLIIFTADHADFAGDYGLYRKGVGLPEDLVRIPMVWNGPKILARENLCESYVSLVDIFPTICSMLGLKVPRGVQGRNLWPLLCGKEDEKEFISMYAEKGVGGRPYSPEDKPPFHGGNFTLHPDTSMETFSELNDVTETGKWKMVVKNSWKLIFDPYGQWELYNLKSDPHELVNLAYESCYRDKKQELMEEMIRWDVQISDLLPLKGYRPIGL